MLKALAATLIATAHFSAAAQTWPDKPIKIIVPFTAGGNADIVARLIGKKLSDGLGTPVVVENRVGANGGIGLEAVKRAAPDGYTLLVSPTSPLVINPAIYAKLPYDTLNDFEPISQIITYQYALIVPEKSTIKTIDDLAAQAKAKPGELAYGSSGVGGGGHLAGELLALVLGVKLNHVPYKGTAAALADLLGGHLSFTFDTVLTSIPLAQAKQVRVLAVSSDRRSGSLPNAPTMQELGYKSFDISQFVGLFAPAKTDPAIIARLNAEVVKAVKSPDIIQALKTDGGNEMVGNTAAEFKSQIVRDLAFYRKLVTDAKIKGE
jgi:tripartite-type tricarboxylate transporter receptor subunit TctC